MALTFITLCRIAGIPARWESGFAVAPGDAGCHDWARFYVAPRGWMYADCSYGASMARRGDEVLRRHYFGSLDTGRMVANSALKRPSTRRCWASAETPTTTRAARWRPTAWACTVTIP